MQYDDFVNNFTTYENVEAPRVTMKMPLMDDPLELDWAEGLVQNKKGEEIPIVKSNIGSFNINNNPESDYKGILYEPTEPNYSQEAKTQNNTQKSYQTNSNLTGKKKRAMEFFMSKGLTNYQAAGIVGNLMHESGLNTSIKGDSGKALGLAQWHPDRQKGLKALAKSRGTTIDDFDTQLEYIWQELNSTEKKALNALLNSKTVEQATDAFVLFERPGNVQLNSRRKHAKSCLS